jgi:hypothetical protein
LGSKHALASPPPRAAPEAASSGTTARARIPPETCWRRCGIARGGRRRPGGCPAPERRRSCPQPAVLAAGFGPELVGRGRIPGGHVDSVGDVPDRALRLPASAGTAAEEAPAHLAVQAAHAVHRPAPAHRQVGHVEILRRVVRVPAAQGQQILERDAELLRGVARPGIARSGRERSGRNRRPPPCAW